MRLSRKSEYALLALIDLAEHAADGPIKMVDISERKKIPKKYLEQLLLQLKSAGIVKSVRGASGGYALSKKPVEISMAQIIRLFDGALGPVQSVSKYFYESTPVEQNKKLLQVFKDIRDYVSNKMESTTLEDLL